MRRAQSVTITGPVIAASTPFAVPGPRDLAARYRVRHLGPARRLAPFDASGGEPVDFRRAFRVAEEFERD